jgi:hypothetical protein
MRGHQCTTHHQAPVEVEVKPPLQFLAAHLNEQPRPHRRPKPQRRRRRLNLPQNRRLLELSLEGSLEDLLLLEPLLLE